MSEEDKNNIEQNKEESEDLNEEEKQHRKQKFYEEQGGDEVKKEIEHFLSAVKVGRETQGRSVYEIIAPKNQKALEKVKKITEDMGLGCEPLPENNNILEVYEKRDSNPLTCYTLQEEGNQYSYIESTDSRFNAIKEAFEEVYGQENIEIKAEEKERIESPGYLERVIKRHEKYVREKERVLKDFFNEERHKGIIDDIDKHIEDLLENDPYVIQAKKELIEILPETIG